MSDEPEVEVLVRSPLLIARVRNPGGAGGRRLEAGVTSGRDDGERAWALIEHRGGGRLPSQTLYATPQALVHAYNAALRDAERAGLASRPEAVALTIDALRLAGGPVAPRDQAAQRRGREKVHALARERRSATEGLDRETRSDPKLRPPELVQPPQCA